MPICKKCSTEKPESQFPTFRNKTPSGAITKGLRKVCKECVNASKKRVFIETKCPSCGVPRKIRKDTYSKTNGLCQPCALSARLSAGGNPPRQYRPNQKLASHPAYARWQGMRARCAGRSPIWKRRYKDRGIKICEEWLHPWVFIDWAVSNGFRPDLTLDRIDNNGPYSPDNCRWTDDKTQARNTKSARQVYLSDGRKFGSLAEAAEALNTSQDRIYKALKNGWRCLGYEISYSNHAG